MTDPILSAAPLAPFAYHPTDTDLLIPPAVEDAAVAIQQAAAAERAVVAIGGGTQWTAGARRFVDSARPLMLSMAHISGILEYDPGELTLTARAGTPLGEVIAALASYGQYLPFDPVFARYGATLGGTVAAGLSGPRRLRYGGLRDFILGIEFLNGAGERVRGGGKVVKNAAGYDLPKLFCGSAGSLGILTEVSFKVFPAPRATRTLLLGVKDAHAAQTALSAIQRSTLEVSAADAWPTGTVNHTADMAGAFTVAVQVDGVPESLEPRLSALRNLIPGASSVTLEGDPEAALWDALRDLAWLSRAPANTVLRLYLPSNRLAELDNSLAGVSAQRVYSAAGNTAWAIFDGDLTRFASQFEALGISAAVWRSALATPDVIPSLPNAGMITRVKSAFDPHGRFYSPLPIPTPIR